MKNNKETLNLKRNKLLLYSTIYGLVSTLVIVIGILYGLAALKTYQEDLGTAIVFSYLVIIGGVSACGVLLNFLAWYFQLNWVVILTLVLLAVLLVLSTVLVFISFIFAVIWIVLVMLSFSQNKGVLEKSEID